MKSIYIPSNLDQANEIATLLDDRSPADLLKCHAAFGAHFGGDMGLVSTQAYCLRGKPSLNADAMAGICRRSGLVRYMRIDSWSIEHCTMHFCRTDEPAEVIHEFTYTMEMANAQGLTRNRNWQQMPLQMLRSRVLTMGLRAVYPDAVSGIYSADEIADSTDMSDDERARISADSLGEEINVSRAPTPKRAPRQSRPPQPVAAPKGGTPSTFTAPPSQPPQPVEPPQEEKSYEPLYEFNSEEGFWSIVDEHNISMEEVNSVAKRFGEDPSLMSGEELEAFFYKYVIHRTVRQSWSWVERWWEDEREGFVDSMHESIKLEYPILESAPPSFYGPKMHEPAFVEAVRQACSMDIRFNSECQRALRYMKADDWSVYYKLVELAKV